MPTKHSTEQLIKKFKTVHGNRYDYSLVTNDLPKVKIICKQHGVFEQSKHTHIKGTVCYQCSLEDASKHRRLDVKKLIERFKSVYGDKYDYSQIVYIKESTKLDIVCPIHGKFVRTAVAHFKCKRGCPKCKKENVMDLEYTKRRFEAWKAKVKQFWGDDTYDLSNTKYVNSDSLVEIKCNKHNIAFKTLAGMFSRGFGGCKQCYDERASGNHRKKFQPIFLKKAQKIHGAKYDYSLVEYITNYIPVKIICKYHGIFEQSPDSHTNMGCGCPTCCSSRGEEKIGIFLNNRNIEYIFQHFVKIDNSNHYFDFYIPSLNLMIEFDGKQHFEPIKFFGGKKAFDETVKRDNIKNIYCTQQKISLLRIPYNQVDCIEEILEEKLSCSVVTV